MSDLEHGINPGGIPEGYTFDQTESHIILTFPVPETIEEASIDFRLEDGSVAIYVHLFRAKLTNCLNIKQNVPYANHFRV